MFNHWMFLLGFAVLGCLGGILALVRFIGENPMGVKQFAIGLGIAMLLPLSVYYAVELVRPAPKEDLHYAQKVKLEQRIQATKNEGQKEQLRAEKAELERRYKEAEKRHKQVLFPIGYLVGMAAIILGTVTAVHGVSTGALFGGLLTLSYACFSYWDDMADWLRFSSLVGALFMLVALGWWRFGHEEGTRERPPSAEPEQDSAAVEREIHRSRSTA